MYLEIEKNGQTFRIVLLFLYQNQNYHCLTNYANSIYKNDMFGIGQHRNLGVLPKKQRISTRDVAKWPEIFEILAEYKYSRIYFPKRMG